MARPASAIPRDVQAEIRKLRAADSSYDAICRAVKKKHRFALTVSSLRRFLAADAKKSADVSTAAPAETIKAIPVGNPLVALERHVELLLGRLQLAAERGTTNEHIRAFKAVAEAMQELERAKAASNGGGAQFKFLPDLLTASRRNDDNLRRKDPAAWLGLQLPELTAVVADVTEALARVPDPGAKNFTGDLPSLAVKLREQLDRFEAARTREPEPEPLPPEDAAA